jgi:hypothetical protein
VVDETREHVHERAVDIKESSEEKQDEKGVGRREM